MLLLVEDTFLSFSSILCWGWGLQGSTPTPPTISHIIMSVVLVQLLPKQSCWWDLKGLASDISRRHNLTANAVILLKTFHLLLEPWSWTLRCSCWIVDASLLTGIYNCILIGCCSVVISDSPLHCSESPVPISFSKPDLFRKSPDKEKVQKNPGKRYWQLLQLCPLLQPVAHVPA